MKEENCIFCKIANGEIPAATLYEDDLFRVILEEDLTDQVLLETIRKVHANRQDYIRAMSGSDTADAVGTIIKLLNEAGGK